MAFVLAVSALSLPAMAQAATTITVTEQRINGAGSVTLDTSLYLPAKLPAPAVLLAHGFTGDKGLSLIHI